MVVSFDFKEANLDIFRRIWNDKIQCCHMS